MPRLRITVEVDLSDYEAGIFKEKDDISLDIQADIVKDILRDSNNSITWGVHHPDWMELLVQAIKGGDGHDSLKRAEEGAEKD